MLFADFGPETIMPVVSVIAAAVGAIAIVWPVWGRSLLAGGVSRRTWTVDHCASSQSGRALRPRLCRVAGITQPKGQHDCGCLIGCARLILERLLKMTMWFLWGGVPKPVVLDALRSLGHASNRHVYPPCRHRSNRREMVILDDTRTSRFCKDYC